jgi:hypothetical protein
VGGERDSVGLRRRPVSNDFLRRRREGEVLMVTLEMSNSAVLRLVITML